MIILEYCYLKINMKLDEIIVLLYFEEGKRDFFIFDSQKSCQKFFKNENNIKNLEEKRLKNYIVFYARRAMVYKGDIVWRG